MEKASEPKKIRTAHSNFRKGLSDYNDGSSLSHHLGNDDYKDGNNLPDRYLGDPAFDGREALGNELLDDDEYQEEEFEEFEEDHNRA